MGEHPKIAILLATYNGSDYLSGQLDSIFDQSYENFVLIARDDGSSDDTVSLLEQYKSKWSERFVLVPGEEANLGARGSFSSLMAYTLANANSLGLEPAYMMFADQDDVWLPHKVATQVEAMLSAERANGTEPLPVLLHSDLQVVDADMAVIAESFMDYQGLDPTRNRCANIAFSNLVTGCTALINEPLARRSLPIDAQAVMHDWWLALVASAFGRLIYLPQPLVCYRQHGNNTIGAKRHESGSLLGARPWRSLLQRRPNAHFHEVAAQARAFNESYHKQLRLRDWLGLQLAVRMAVNSGLLQRVIYRIARRL